MEMELRKEIRTLVKEYIDADWELDVLVEEIYNDDSNYNNADKTSGQECYSYDEIHEAVYSIMEEEE